MFIIRNDIFDTGGYGAIYEFVVVRVFMNEVPLEKDICFFDIT